uniref:P0 n=1 Tax=Cucurbit aphid-borne yellows virus TaxID=91753 RepID=A0A8E7C1Q1_9VIRU|nr:P0 [Melon aphid-borne yellows virus]
MHIETVKQQLVFRATRRASTDDPRLSISSFLVDYVHLYQFLTQYGEQGLRVFLARLPLLISEQLQGDYVYTPGVTRRIMVARFHRHCGAPLPSSSAVDLRLPATKDVARFFLARHYSRVMGEGLQRHQTDLFRGYTEFQKFINVWCSSTSRRLRESTPRAFPIDRIFVELSNLGIGLRALALTTGVYYRDALARIALHVHRIYGEDGGLDFWRLANLPSKSWPFSSERYLAGSVVQRELQS